jgi:hypothetical protein
MKLIKNAYVTQSGAYYSSGGLVVGSQRIPSNHLMEYWQQANIETSLALKIENNSKIKKVKEALYIGRIPLHFGHFLLEGMPRLCDVCTFKIPIIGFTTKGLIPKGLIPKGIFTTPIESINWVIDILKNKKLYQVSEKEIYQVENLFIPELPLQLSQSCAEPQRMTPMIKKIVEAARKKNSKISYIENLYLKRSNEKISKRNKHTISDPSDHISKQIAMVSYAKKLYGNAGSNTHISMFAHQTCRTNFNPRGDFQQTDRNQLICDLIKTFNDYKF